ncbi:Ig-like domain repeat protein [Acidobacterium sp.]|uniref:NHL repeat protein n=1 Tax=Acidobacterium capsulatum (strain ATCC 51196 / DSM 11244 / BCRC 80197 / JCM 7670 / NBRC 15755 / NCIMB 13165 / 161) TaxID=240015 RepID=C1F4Q6_ACIC5|nr:Ig-like domain repeat protein [Acidobacterium sp.]ACO34549.1 hypothetical protein ACP_1177 [Acidobacterium capsulatum ATCC 51196]
MKFTRKMCGQELTRPLRKRDGKLSCWLTACLALTLAWPASLYGQAILRVTPGTSTATVAGTGSAGYSGNGGAATSAAFASPSAVAYDGSGNLYIADTNNNVIREVSTTGVVTTIAGNGEEGYSGDGAAATSAMLDTPTGIAVDSNGNIYIADSHNNRIREVSNGIINTVAGNGTAGYSGDGAAATSAMLDDPTAVAVDASGNIYIADTGNQRIRNVAAGTIHTVAGNGEEGYSGDGAAAASAELDTPTGIAVDSSGNIYIADSHNNRIREVSGGVINTVAGSGAVTFPGSYSGDGGSATAATLAKPTGVALDAAGHVYIADTNNERLREIANGVIATVAGNGQQGYSGDGAAATSAALNDPRNASVNASGSVAVADTLNERVRGLTPPTLTYASQPIGIASSPQYITIANAGSGTLAIQSLNITGDFATASSGTCPALPIALAANASCTQAIVFQPAHTGSQQGSITVGGSSLVPQTILLSGSATISSATPQLTSSLNPSIYGKAVTFTATVAAGTQPTPTGSITFSDGGSPLQTVTMTGGSASYTTALLAAGSHSITAAYSGDTAWKPATSTALTQTVQQVAPTIDLRSSSASILLDNPVTFTATVASGNGAPGGTVIFLDGATALGSVPINAGQASLTVNSLATGAHSITAIYSGDTNFTSVTSSVVAVQVSDFNLNISSSTTSVTSATVTPGGTATYQLSLSPVGKPTFPTAVTLSASGLPAGATATFSPAVIPAGAGTTQVTLTIQVPKTLAALRAPALPHGTAPTYLGLLLLPPVFGVRRRTMRSASGRRKALRRQRVLVGLLALTALASMIGCGYQSGYFGQQQKTYTITITGTSGALSHSTSVQLTVE